jgi:mannose-6-phosphate isomerase-like protein (cupin superfamily)
MENKVNLAEKLALLDGPFQPGIVGTMNDYKLAVVRVRGEFVWHKHDDTDELFLVTKGTVLIRFRDREVTVGPGELLVVPRGVEHMPVAKEECELLLIEPVGTPNTGDAGGARTARPDWI